MASPIDMVEWTTKPNNKNSDGEESILSLIKPEQQDLWLCSCYMVWEVIGIYRYCATM